MSWNFWAFIILGAWLIISPWILGFSGLNIVVWNVIIVGVLIIVLALWNRITKP